MVREFVRGEPCEPTNLRTTTGSLERNVVVGDWFHRRFIAAAVRHAGAAAVHRGAAAAATASAAEQRDAVGLDLRRIALVAVFVVPLTRLQAAFDVDLLTLREVFLQALRLLPPEDDAVPFGLFLALPALVVPHLGRGEIERRHGGAS